MGLTDGCFDTSESPERGGMALAVVRVASFIVVAVSLVPVLVLLVREGLICA